MYYCQAVLNELLSIITQDTIVENHTQNGLAKAGHKQQHGNKTQTKQATSRVIWMSQDNNRHTSRKSGKVNTI